MIEWNTVKYIDCMDPNEGLPSLPDKSIDLCVTDPPYNINYTTIKSKKQRKAVYNDNLSADNYKIWCYSWFDELKRICDGIIFTPGLMNKQMWFEKEVFELLIWNNNYKQGQSKNSKLTKFELILTYGTFNSRFLFNFLHYNSGFNMQFDYYPLLHPCPKPRKLYDWIIKSVEPNSVLDPFLGSGTTAEVCTKLGIKWLGYEINEVYFQDINKRLKGCKKEPEQQLVERWIK